MAVQLEATIKRFRGLSTDIKPGSVSEDGGPVQRPPVGSEFIERDTGRRFRWSLSGAWERQEQTIEPLLTELIDTNRQILEMLAATQRGHIEHLWEDRPPPE